MTDWTGPSYDAVELLGYGPASEVWRGRVRATGERVVLRRLTEPDPALAARARTTPRGPHLLRVREVLGDEVLVVEHAPGGSLEALLARRGALTPGEVVTALAPVAAALVEVRHGAVRASSVLLDAAGRPLLEVPGEGEADDVRDLAALAVRCLSGRSGGELPATCPLPLRSAVEAAAAGELSTTDLAAALLAACPAVPLAGLSGAPAVPQPAGSRRWPLVLAPVVLLGAVVAAGWGWGREGGGEALVDLPAPSATASPAAEPDWAAVLAGLDRARALAFARRDPVLLESVWSPTSPQRAADLALLQRSGGAAAGHEVRSVAVVERGLDRVVLRVVERLGESPYAQHRVVLERTATGWRVASVSG